MFATPKNTAVFDLTTRGVVGDSIRGNGSHKEAEEKPRAWDADCGTEAVKQLLLLADSIRTNGAETRALMLGSIEALLAGADVLSCDCIETLKAERDVLQGGMQSQQLEDDCEEPAWAKIPFDDCADDVDKIGTILDKWPPDKQRAIVNYVLAGLPDKEAAWAAESSRDSSRDELLNYLHNNRSMPDQAAIYRAALAAVKNDNGIIELKKVG